MSETWHGGKGSKQRPTKNPSKFRDNWDKIFTKRKKNEKDVDK